MRLAGEVAIVTGATSGIGKAIAVLFAAEGASVVVTGRDGARGGHVLAAMPPGSSAAFIPTELTDEAACAALVADAADRFGSLTVLVNCAVAAERDGPVTTMETAAWEAILRVNLLAPAWLCRAAIPRMAAAGRGSIVNVSSRAAVRGTPGVAAYSASKGALEALTRAIAVDHAPDGIRCNAIGLGYVVNERRDGDIDADAARRARLEAMHLTGLGTARDAAYAALYLASAESAFVTGTTLAVDGGSTAARARSLG